MPIYDNLLEIQGIAAKNDALRADAEERKAKAGLYVEQAKLLGEDAETQRMTRAAMQAAQLAEDANAQATSSAVTPESTAAVAQAADPIQKAIQDGMQTIKQQREVASQIRRVGGDPKEADKAEQLAVQAEQTVRHNLNLAFDRQRQVAKDVASAAGSALPDGSNLGQVQAKLDALNPNWMKKADVDTDVFGNLAWGKRTQNYLATMQAQGVAADKQLEERQKKIDADFKEKQLEQRVLEEKNRNERHDADVRVRRDGLEERKQDRQARIDAATAKKEADKKPVNPTKAEVDATATLFTQDPEIKLPPAQAQIAAWDYQRKVNEAIAKGADRATAEADARAAIVDRVKTTIEKGGWFSKDRETREYDKWKAEPEGSDLAKQLEPQQRELAAVGIGSKASADGKITLHVMPGRTPPDKAALITKAQEAIDSGKYDPIKVIEILKQKMVQ